MTQEGCVASRREFLLYWAGFLIAIVSLVSILMAISGLLVDAMSYRCWYPIISPILDSIQPKPTQVEYAPFNCANPAVAVVRFLFNFLAALVFAGAGLYMMMSGKKR